MVLKKHKSNTTTMTKMEIICHISGNQTQCKAQEINHDQRGVKMQQEHLNQMSGYTVM